MSASATGEGPMRRFAVVGSPIAHSLSPALHRAAYRELGLEGRAAYDAHRIEVGGLEAFLASPAGRELSGLSVTMPLKREAFALAARADAVATRLSIANTLLRAGDGSWSAENHDVHGIVASLREVGVDRPGTVAILGSGATAVSAAAAALELGAVEVLLSARSPRKLADAIAVLDDAVPVRIVDWSRAEDALDADVVISALAEPGAQALAEHLRGLEREGAALPMPGAALDVVYDPWPAPLAALLAERGTAVASGLEMLVHQAGRQVESMLGVPAAPLAAMRAAALDELSARTA